MQAKRFSLFCDATFERGRGRAGASLCLCGSKALRSDFRRPNLFPRKTLDVLRGKIKEFLLRGAIKRAESHKCLAEYKGG